MNRFSKKKKNSRRKGGAIKTSLKSFQNLLKNRRPVDKNLENIKSVSFTQGMPVERSKELLQFLSNERGKYQTKMTIDFFLKSKKSNSNAPLSNSNAPLSMNDLHFKYNDLIQTINKYDDKYILNGNEMIYQDNLYKIIENKSEYILDNDILKAIIVRLTSEVNLEMWNDLIENILNIIGRYKLIDEQLSNDNAKRFYLFLYGNMEKKEMDNVTKDDLDILNKFFSNSQLNLDLNSLIKSNTKIIGKGGTGIVYKLESPNCAVKILKIPQYSYNIIKNNIINYIKVLQNCDPKRYFCNLLNISTFTQDDTTSLALITDYCGESLGDYIKRYNSINVTDRIPEEKIRNIMIDIVSAIKIMHQNNIAHLDIKPDNILIYKTSNNTLIGKLIDFGLSKEWSDKIPMGSFYGTSCFVDKYIRDKIRDYNYNPLTEPTNIDNRETIYPNIIEMDIYALARTFMYLYSDNTLSPNRRQNCIQKHETIIDEYSFFQKLGICILYKLKRKRLFKDELVLRTPKERMNIDEILDILNNPEKICDIIQLKPPYYL